jgi:hypothetical protein
MFAMPFCVGRYLKRCRYFKGPLFVMLMLRTADNIEVHGDHAMTALRIKNIIVVKGDCLCFTKEGTVQRVI